ncbi:MAG: hypothetical protein NTU44_12425 [Bacteroidetes bacterium]|nr:hypothetical protein [Bacteroidota bacterium]
MNFRIKLLAGVLLVILATSCKKEKETKGSGKISFEFDHQVDGQLVAFDTMMYVNAAGNHYLITDFQYFVSDFILYKSDGTQVLINKEKDIHYIDSSIPSTLLWSVADDIPEGDYDSISFTFGINQQKNVTGLFVNPPEVNMFWPDFMGGGYHYIKLNGKWKNPDNQEVPFNFHMGIGSDTTNTGEVVYVQNYFKRTLPASSFTIHKGWTLSVIVVMNIDSWFTTPHLWDWNVIGGSIMQYQWAMQLAKENGMDVFTIGSIF